MKELFKDILTTILKPVTYILDKFAGLLNTVYSATRAAVLAVLEFIAPSLIFIAPFAVAAFLVNFLITAAFLALLFASSF